MNPMTDIKPGLLVCLLSIIISSIFANAQDDTPYPEGYLNEATRVDMSRAPDVFVTKNGNEVATRVVDGRKWIWSWYWATHKSF